MTVLHTTNTVGTEIIKLLAWPAVVFVLGIVAIFILRAPLTRLIDRIRRIGVGASGVESPPITQEVPREAETRPSEELMRAFDSPLLQERENAVRQDLQNRNVTDPHERENILIRHYASVSVAWILERIYITIFGSQIRALAFLNTRSVLGASRDEVQAFYTLAQAQWPAIYGSYSYDRWLSFLENSNLISRRQDNFQITLLGREFLRYLMQEGHSLEKIG